MFDRQVIVNLDDRSYEGLRVDFSVEKTLGPEANSASIEIYNVPFEDGAAARAQRRELVVRLFAGYDTPSLIFEGNPIKGGVDYEREPADTVLKLECKDGYRRYKDTRINASFATGTSFKDIADEIAKQMGIPAATIRVPERKTLTQGVVLTGDPETVLRRVGEAVGANASIQNGNLQILPEADTNTNLAPLYSTELGNLLTYADTDYGISLKVLLDDTLVPGDRFRMEHPDKSGVFKATKIVYTGGEWTDDYYCEIEAIESPGVT